MARNRNRSKKQLPSYNPKNHQRAYRPHTDKYGNYSVRFDKPEVLDSTSVDADIIPFQSRPARKQKKRISNKSFATAEQIDAIAKEIFGPYDDQIHKS